MRERLSESLSAFKAVFANPNLRRVELAWAGSETGKWMYVIGVAVFAYDQGGASAVGLVALIRVLSGAITAPFAAVLSDRFRRERVMLFADISRAIVLAGAALVVSFDGPPAVIYALAAVVNALSTTFRPAQSALLPSIARTPEELTAANVTMSTIAAVGLFAGPAVGGLLLGVTDVATLFAITAGTFVLSAVQVARIRADPPPAREREAAAKRHVLREALVGFTTIGSEPRLRLIMGLYSAQTLVAGALGVLVVVASIQLLHFGPAGVGYLNSAFGIGGLIGAGFAVLLVARQRLASDFAIGTLFWGAPLILVGIFPSKPASLILFAFVGVGDTVVEVAAPTLLQRVVPDEILGRVFGVVESLLYASMGVGAILAPVLVDALGTRGALIVSGAFLPALALLAWRRLNAIDKTFTPPVEQLELLGKIPIFAPLPPAELEHLAHELVPLRVSAGDAVVREGEAGDRFYVVRSGELEVSVDGKTVRTLGAGDHFGEIALLRDVPRTATVAARSDVDLYALDRDEFIGSVTGHAPSAEAADAVVMQRLAAARTGLATE